MQLCDVNVLVYAHREDVLDHEQYRTWLEDLINGPEAYGVSDQVLSGFVRVATHPRVFDPPSPLEQVLDFADRIRSQPNAVSLAPGPRHWGLFVELCRNCEARGNLVPDAWLAALAIESGSEWITTDRDFSRFKGLRWRHPLAA
jgi:uncharacterized protein